MPNPRSNPRDTPDDELWLRLREQDEAALRALYDRHAPKMLAVGRAVLRDTQLAEDVLTRVWVEVWERPDRFDPARGRSQTFLLMLMRSRSIDRLRQRRTASPNTHALTHDQVSDEGQAPDARAIREETNAQLHDALAELPDEQRDVLWLSFFDGLSHAQIAEKTGQPLGTVKGRIRLALKRLAGRVNAPAQRGNGTGGGR